MEQSPALASTPAPSAPITTLGPYQLADLTPESFIDHVVALVDTADNERPTVVFSLHVGGLNLRRKKRFTDALRAADVLVADGISVAVLARIAGASGLHRHPTTDRGWELLDRVADHAGHRLRVALVGGPPGLAERAGAVMNKQAKVDVVVAHHGYHADWTAPLAEIREARCDVVIVGMGMPNEAYWVTENLPSLPNALFLTCGGWFGHIVGDEKRAPAWMRKLGLEWLARLAQSPARLWRRYAAGLWSIIAMIPTALASRRVNKKALKPGH